MHVFKLKIECNRVDKNKDMSIVSLVVHLLNGWWFHVLQGVKDRCMNGLMLLFCMAMRHICT
jgi:hypothetical protein